MAWGTYPTCAVCWNRRHAIDSRRTVNEVEDLYGVGADETCCYCGSRTRAGIWVREDSHHVRTGAVAS